MQLKPWIVALVLLAGCIALLAARGWLFSSRLDAPRPLTPLRFSTELTVYYHDRHPYYFEHEGQVRGLVVDIAAAALRRAEIPHRWVAMPPARQLQELRDGSGYIAGIGWLATAERRKFASYSDPLWQDGSFVAIARIGDPRLRAGRRLEELFADPSLTLLIKDTYSYGTEADALLARLKPASVRTPSPSGAMLRMIEEKRADYFLLATEEAEALLQGENARALRIVPLADAPRGIVRHLMFSRRVPAALVERFNTALREIQPPR